jgi:hypothetical protein
LWGAFEFEILKIGRPREVENLEGPHSETIPYLKGLGCTGSLKIQAGKWPENTKEKNWQCFLKAAC